MTPDELTKLHNSIKHLLELSAKHEGQFTEVKEQFTEVKRIFRITHDSLKRLERIAMAHEARLSRLEKKRNK
jgi:hypothetical protein